MKLQAIPGQRVLIKDALLERCSNYQGTFRDIERTIYRYLFRSPSGVIVYSGNRLEIELGQIVDLRATVKRFEYSYGEMMRISRPKIVENYARKSDDFS
jgi:virulence-associated protein VapD